MSTLTNDYWLEYKTEQFEKGSIDQKIDIIRELHDYGFEREARSLSVDLFAEIHREGGVIEKTDDGKMWIMFLNATDWFGNDTVAWIELPDCLKHLA